MALTPPPTTPVRTMAQTVFDSALATFLAWFSTNTSELSALQTDVVAKQTQTGLDAVATAADRAQTGLDAIATAADRAQTGLDKVAAAASAASAAAIAGSFVGTSTTELLIETGEKIFVTQAGEQYTDGIFMTAVSAANPDNYMAGQVSYAGTTLTMTVALAGGSGTHSDWNLSIAGVPGPPGAGVTPDAIGFHLSGGTTPKNLIVDADLVVSDIINGVYGTSTAQLHAIALLF